MGKLIVLMAFATVMFGAAAAASWWWQQQQLAESEVAAAHPALASPAGEANTAGPASSSDVPDPGLPVAVRPRPMSVEELLRYGLSLNARDESLKQREDEFRQREMQIQLALADVQTEQTNIDGLRAQVQKQLETADKLLEKINASRKDLAAEQERSKAQLEDFKVARIEMDDQERESIKRLATWVRAMEAEKAAEVLKEMANDGRMVTAVKILANLEEREVAKILDSVGDSVLIDSFIKEYQKIRPEIKKSAGRGTEGRTR